MVARSDQRGDTIIEVLLAMVVVGLTLGIGFNIAQRAQRTGIVARERVEASALAESQIELLKANLNDAPDAAITYGYQASEYCILSDDPQANVGADIATDCDNIREIGGSDGFYNLRMSYTDPNSTPDDGDEYYISSVVWDTPTSNVDAEVEIRYRVYE